MKEATSTGLAMKAVCDPSIESVVAPIRWAMNLSASGDMALSCSDTRNQDGLVFHPASVAFSVSAASGERPLRREHNVGDVDGDVGAERLPEPFLADVQVWSLRRADRRVRRRDGGGSEQRRRERLLHAGAALAHFQPERGQVHQPRHVLQAGGCLRDHRPAVRVPHEDDRAVDGAGHRADGGGVGSDAA